MITNSDFIESIHWFGLDARTRNCIYNELADTGLTATDKRQIEWLDGGIRYREITRHTEVYWMRSPNFGKASLKDLKGWLWRRSLFLQSPAYAGDWPKICGVDLRLLKKKPTPEELASVYRILPWGSKVKFIKSMNKMITKVERKELLSILEEK